MAIDGPLIDGVTGEIIDEGPAADELASPSESPLKVPYAQLDKAVKPLFLLADSQLLFSQAEPFLGRARALLARGNPSAVYLGASNGDDPAYYSIFEAAMAEVGIRERCHVRADLGPADLDAVDHADLILLAGGDVERGWRTFEANGLKQILTRRYYEGALLVGLSAGAVQLGLGGWSGQPESAPRFVDTFRLIPHVLGAHEEADDWASLKAAVVKMGGHVRGYGIPFGGGLIYHPDHALEPVRKPVVEIRARGTETRQSLLLPGEVTAEASGDGA